MQLLMPPLAIRRRSAQSVARQTCRPNRGDV